MSLFIISCIIGTQVDANPKQGAERYFSFERPQTALRFPFSPSHKRFELALRARFQPPAFSLVQRRRACGGGSRDLIMVPKSLAPIADRWSHGVMVITLDFESSGPSSNLGGTST